MNLQAHPRGNCDSATLTGSTSKLKTITMLNKQWNTGRVFKSGSLWWCNIIISGTSMIVAKCCGKSKSEALMAGVHICDLHNQTFINQC